MKPVVFVSHIHSESKIAIWLEESISEVLLGAIEFFVSSDKSSIVGGDKWLLKIEEALKKASVMIVVCSKESVLRPWINFEAGGAWMAGKRVVPVCHAGMSPENLPEPLKSLQAYQLTNEDHIQDLVALLAREAGLRNPKFSVKEFVSSLPDIVADVCVHDEPQLIEISGGIAKVGTGWLLPEHDPRDLSDSHRRVSVLRKRLRIPGEEDRKKAILPAIVDLRSWCSEPRNQGGLNSSTAHAVISMVEYFERRNYGRSVDLSRLFVYKQARNLMHLQGDSGASLRSTLHAITLFGVPPSEFWPYTDKKPDYDLEPPAHVYSLGLNYQGAVYFSHDPMHRNFPEAFVLAKVKTYLAAGIPSVFGFLVFPSFERADQLGCIPFPELDEKTRWKQAVLAIGYDDGKKIRNRGGKTVTKGALLFQNSWGKNWGEAGYGWIPYEYVFRRHAFDFWSIVKDEWFDTAQFGL